jgi:hypothetical protein
MGKRSTFAPDFWTVRGANPYFFPHGSGLTFGVSLGGEKLPPQVKLAG